MKVSAEKIGKTKAQVTVEIPEDEFEVSLQKAYRVVVKKVNIPGFRKGKAPRHILENMYGKEILMEDAIQDAVPNAYLKALDEIKDEYTAISAPEYELIQTELNKPVIFKAIFDIKPEVKLGQYKGLKLEKRSTELKEEQVEEELSRMQQRYAKLVVVEGPAQEGDVLTIDFVGKVDGQPFEGGSAQDYSLELGSKSFIPGFEDQLAGANKGETREIAVTFPAEYHSEELQGKDAVFNVTVKDIKRKELSPLDDEFAKDVSEFENMQELRQDIENKLKEMLEKQAEQELRNAAVSKAVEAADVELPESMIINRVRRMIEDFALGMQRQGISLEYYLQATNKKPEELLEAYRPKAEASLRTDLVLEAIAKAEKIQVSAADLDEEIQKIAGQVAQEKEKVREMLEKQGQISSLEFGIMIDKAVDLIINEAEVKEAKEA